MNIYIESGHLDIKKVLQIGTPFIFIIGGRGTGKTYGSLEYVIENNIKFMFMRRTQSQCDLINKPDFSPFKRLNYDHDWNIISYPITKYNYGFYNSVEKDGKNVPSGKVLGYTCALSTVSNIRGFDASDIELLIYDEFIKESHDKTIKSEASAFFNAYETMNRNRELEGRKPIQCLCLANSNDIANPLFMELNLVNKIAKMAKKNQEVYIDSTKGITVIYLRKSKISEQKKETAISALTVNTTYNEMSIENNFEELSHARVNSRPLIEYIPVAAFGDMYVYKHKSNYSDFFVSSHKRGEFKGREYNTGEIDKLQFRRVYSWLWMEFVMNHVRFESYLLEKIFCFIYK